MVYYRRRSSYRKKSTKKYSKRKIIKRYLRKKVKTGNCVVSKLKLRFTEATTSLQTGIHSPLLVNAQMWNGGGSLPADFINYSALYDDVRLAAIKIKYIPYGNVNVINQTGPVNLYNAPIYFCIDYNNEYNNVSPTPLSINAMQEYENCKMFNPYRPWKKYIKVPKLLADASSGIKLRPGWQDISVAEMAQSTMGSYYIRSESLGGTELELGGQFWITWYMAFKNRK